MKVEGGRWVISPTYDAADDFCRGVARVGVETLGSKIQGVFIDKGINVKWYYVDRSGKKVKSSNISSHK
jgi:hypothetical protein